MFRIPDQKKQDIVNKKVHEMNGISDDCVLECSLEKNIAVIRKLFRDVDLFRVKYIVNNQNKKLKYCIAFCESVIDVPEINNNIIKPLMLSTVRVCGKASMDIVMDQIVQIVDAQKTEKITDIVEAVSCGKTVLFLDGFSQAVLFNTKCHRTRAITEPQNEKNLSGPREGFTESLMLNLSLIRRKMLSPDLKMKFYSLGRRSNTKACICYMDGLVNKQILAELYRRLDKIDMDAVLDTNYIAELIKDARISPFRTTGYTERPDIVIGKLLEGRIAVFLEGTPDVLTVPYLFIENFQSSEDYYMNFFYSSFSRMIRMIGFFLTITIPGFYIAIGAYHHEMFPLQLFINIAAERQSVPFPAALEALLMLFAFDILRETGVRMPSNIGQALSIVGALVIGQAAVEAKLIAAPMIIVIALTGITNLLVPKMDASVIFIRLLLLLTATCFGFFGLILGLAGILIHIINLRSFGVAQVTLNGRLRYQDMKDTAFRAPWWQMLLRPVFAMNRVRMKGSGGCRD